MYVSLPPSAIDHWNHSSLSEWTAHTMEASPCLVLMLNRLVLLGQTGCVPPPTKQSKIENESAPGCKKYMYPPSWKKENASQECIKGCQLPCNWPQSPSHNVELSASTICVTAWHFFPSENSKPHPRALISCERNKKSTQTAALPTVPEPSHNALTFWIRQTTKAWSPVLSSCSLHFIFQNLLHSRLQLSKCNILWLDGLDGKYYLSHLPGVSVYWFDLQILWIQYEHELASLVPSCSC